MNNLMDESQQPGQVNTSKKPKYINLQISGWIYKRSDWLKVWRIRYIHLLNKKLFCMKKRKSKPYQIINLDDYSEVHRVSLDSTDKFEANTKEPIKWYTFKIISYHTLSYYFRVKTEDDLNKWITIIQNNLQAYQMYSTISQQDPFRRRAHSIAQNMNNTNLSNLVIDDDENDDLFGITFDQIFTFIDLHGGERAFENLKTIDILRLIKEDTFPTQTSYLTKLKQENKFAVKKANIYISHVWGLPFLDELKYLRNYFANEIEIENNEIILWYDLFTLNHHHPTSIPSQSSHEWEEKLIFRIQKIGRVVIVALPPQSPICFHRLWCLLEFYLSIKFATSIEIAIPNEYFYKLSYFGLINFAFNIIEHLKFEFTSTSLLSDREKIRKFLLYLSNDALRHGNNNNDSNVDAYNYLFYQSSSSANSSKFSQLKTEIINEEIKNHLRNSFLSKLSLQNQSIERNNLLPSASNVSNKTANANQRKRKEFFQLQYDLIHCQSIPELYKIKEVILNSNEHSTEYKDILTLLIDGLIFHLSYTNLKAKENEDDEMNVMKDIYQNLTFNFIQRFYETFHFHCYLTRFLIFNLYLPFHFGNANNREKITLDSQEFLFLEKLCYNYLHYVLLNKMKIHEEECYGLYQLLLFYLEHGLFDKAEYFIITFQQLFVEDLYDIYFEIILNSKLMIIYYETNQFNKLKEKTIQDLLFHLLQVGLDNNNSLTGNSNGNDENSEYSLESGSSTGNYYKQYHEKYHQHHSRFFSSFRRSSAASTTTTPTTSGAAGNGGGGGGGGRSSFSFTIRFFSNSNVVENTPDLTSFKWKYLTIFEEINTTKRFLDNFKLFAPADPAASRALNQSSSASSSAATTPTPTSIHSSNQNHLNSQQQIILRDELIKFFHTVLQQLCYHYYTDWNYLKEEIIDQITFLKKIMKKLRFSMHFHQELENLQTIYLEMMEKACGLYNYSIEENPTKFIENCNISLLNQLIYYFQPSLENSFSFMNFTNFPLLKKIRDYFALITFEKEIAALEALEEEELWEEEEDSDLDDDEDDEGEGHDENGEEDHDTTPVIPENHHPFSSEQSIASNNTTTNNNNNTNPVNTSNPPRNNSREDKFDENGNIIVQQQKNPENFKFCEDFYFHSAHKILPTVWDCAVDSPLILLFQYYIKSKQYKKSKELITKYILHFQEWCLSHHHYLLQQERSNASSSMTPATTTSNITTLNSPPTSQRQTNNNNTSTWNHNSFLNNPLHIRTMNMLTNQHMHQVLLPKLEVGEYYLNLLYYFLSFYQQYQQEVYTLNLSHRSTMSNLGPMNRSQQRRYLMMREKRKEKVNEYINAKVKEILLFVGNQMKMMNSHGIHNFSFLILQQQQPQQQPPLNVNIIEYSYRKLLPLLSISVLQELYQSLLLDIIHDFYHFHSVKKNDTNNNNNNQGSSLNNNNNESNVITPVLSIPSDENFSGSANPMNSGPSSAAVLNTNNNSTTRRATLPTVLFSLMLIYSPQQRRLLAYEIKDLNELFLNSFLYRCNFTFPYTVSNSSSANASNLSNSSTTSTSAVVHSFAPHLSPNQQNKLLQEEFLKFTFKEGFRQMNPMPLHYFGSLLIFIALTFWESNPVMKEEASFDGPGSRVEGKANNLLLLFPNHFFFQLSNGWFYSFLSVMVLVFFLDIYFEFLQFEILFHYYQSAGHLPPPRPSNVLNSLIHPPNDLATASTRALTTDLFSSTRSTTMTTTSSTDFNPQYRPLQTQQIKQKRKLRFQRISKRFLYYLTISFLFPILAIDFLENYFFILWDNHGPDHSINSGGEGMKMLFWVKLISLSLVFYGINLILGHYVNLILFHYF